MKNVKTFLQQGPLTTAGIEMFDLWKEDILRAGLYKSISVMSIVFLTLECHERI